MSKKLKKGWKQLESFEEMQINLDKGNYRYYLNNKYEIVICYMNKENDEFGFDIDFIPEELMELFKNCDVVDYNEDGSERYETTEENFCILFTKLIYTNRITFPKRQ